MIQVDRHMLLTGRRQIGTSMYVTKVSRVSVCTHVACSPGAGRIGPPRSEKPPRSSLRPPESTLVGVHLDARWSKSSDLAEGQSSIRGRPNRGGMRLGTREARGRGPSAPPPGLGELARRGGRKRKRVRMRLARQLRVAQSARPGGGERLREQRQQRLASATQDVPQPRCVWYRHKLRLERDWIPDFGPLALLRYMVDRSSWNLGPNLGEIEGPRVTVLLGQKLPNRDGDRDRGEAEQLDRSIFGK